MEHKQCTSDDLNYSPYYKQCFLADRFAKKSNNLNIPDTIPENCSAELNEESLKMEAPKVAAGNLNCEDEKNVCINLQVKCNDSINSSSNISINNSYIRQCERKLLESSDSEDDKSVVNKQFIDVQRKLIYDNDTISTPPSLLRKEISLLRNEMTEAHEFHDFEIQVLKEEKLNEANSYNYLELFEKYSTLMGLYTTLKAEYDDYRKEQEKIRQEYQSRTADCLEVLCSQIEASDSSLNFSSTSFVSFNGGIKSSTMMEDVSEVEATVVHDATVLANDPLSITNDTAFKTPMQTPLKSAKKFSEKIYSTAMQSEVRLLDLFNETTTESCKKIKNEEIIKHNAEKEDWEGKKKSELSSIIDLQNQTSLHLVELENFKKICDNLEIKLRKAESVILTRDEEIRMLQSHISTLRETQEDFASVRRTLSELESRLTLTEAEKKAAENRHRELEAVVQNLERDIQLNGKRRSELQSQLLLVEEKKSEIESENFRLRQLYDTLKGQMTEVENIVKSNEFEVTLFKKNLALADETILQLKSQLESVKAEKNDLENRCSELLESNQHLQVEINNIKNLEKTNEKILNENDNLKQSILEKEKTMIELKTELELCMEKQMINFRRIEELTKEIENLKKENSAFSNTLDIIEKSSKNSADLLSDIKNDKDLFSDGITKLSENSSKLEESVETRGTKIISIFKETIIKTCKEVQNDLVKHYDNEKLEWKSQRDIDLNLITSLQDQIKCLTEKCAELETIITEINIEKENLTGLFENLKTEMSEAEEIISNRNEEIKILKSQENVLQQTKNDLVEADKTIVELNSQIVSILAEKAEIENRCSELLENNQHLQVEINNIKNLETISTNDKILNENDNLKQSILEKEKIMVELTKEIENLKKENSAFSKTLDIVEESPKVLADLLSDIKNDKDLFSDGITKLSENSSKLEESVETRGTKIISIFKETIIKTCKEVQNDLVKHYDNEKLEWKSQRDIDLNLITSLQDQIKCFTEKCAELETKITEINIEKENLTGLFENLKTEISEAEEIISNRNEEIKILKSQENVLQQTKNDLAEADKTIAELNSQIVSILAEKAEIENRCSELLENNQHLQVEINNIKNLEKTNEKILNENDNLKQSILEKEKIMVELTKEIENLKKENSAFSKTLDIVEESPKVLADLLSDIKNDKDLFSDGITKLSENSSKLEVSVETRGTKIISVFKETIIKTCKEVQNDLVKHYDNEKLEWKSQRDIDLNLITSLQDQIKCLTEKCAELETIITEINIEKENLTGLFENLKTEMSEAEEIISNRNEEIKILKSQENVLQQTKNDLAEADKTIVELNSQIVSILAEKAEIENLCRSLEQNLLSFQIEIETKQTITNELDEMKIVRERIENENSDLKQQIFKLEELIVILKKNLEEAKKEQSSGEVKIQNLQKEIDLLKNEQEGLKAENKHLNFGIDSLKQKVKQLTKLICETTNSDLKEALSNINSSHPYSMSLRSKSKNMDICVRRLDRLEEINHNLTEILTRILTITEFPDLEKLKLCSVRDFSNIMKKVTSHFKDLESKMKELKEENAQLDEECETYSNIIKDLKKEAAAVWKSNKEKAEEMESKISRLNEEKNYLENEKQELLKKISKLEGESQKLKSTLKTEEPFHNCICGNESKKINELKRAVLVKEQKLLELQDLETQISSYKSQIEYLKTALEREKKKVGEEKEKNKKLQDQLNESTKNQKTENKKTDENQILDELRMRGSISGGIVQEFVDKEKMRKLSKDIGILKELCRARYAEIKRLEAANAALKSGTSKNSNQMDSPLCSRGYNTRSKNQVRDLWRTEISGKENGAV